MKIVVDTNIAFSAILNTNSKIAHIILRPRKNLQFISTSLLLSEILEHKNKIQELPNYSTDELTRVISLITNKIRFINPVFIPLEIFIKSEQLLHDTDIDDTEFVALTEYSKAKLWTGTKN